METNRSAVETLILCYINTKHLLSSRRLDEDGFNDQLVSFCKKNGFYYPRNEIITTWRKLVLKYKEIKNSPNIEDRNNNSLFYKVVDCIYEPSDFQNRGANAKFTREMLWFLIEMLLKRRDLKIIDGHLDDIHQEFIDEGYVHIQKQEIKIKWENLNYRLQKFKNDSVYLTKFPYLVALNELQIAKGKCLVKMKFTKTLTKVLIRLYSKVKIMCGIHGYDSVQVLNKIQEEFRNLSEDLGYEFTHEEIKSQWNKLVIIYDFLKYKGQENSDWIHFEAMKEHFRDSINVDSLTERTDNSKSVPESKSEEFNAKSKLIVSVEMLTAQAVSPESTKQQTRYLGNPVETVELELDINQKDTKVEPGHEDLAIKQILPTSLIVSPVKQTFKTDSKIAPRKQILDASLNFLPLKRPLENSPEAAPMNKIQKTNSDDTLVKQIVETSTAKSMSSNNHKLKLNEKMCELVDDTCKFSEPKINKNSDLGQATSQVHIINIDQSNIDEQSGNLTINLPSLKMRQRVDDCMNNESDPPEKFNGGFLGFSSSEYSRAPKSVTSISEDELNEVVNRITKDRQHFNLTGSVNYKDIRELSGITYNHQPSYDSCNRKCFPKEDSNSVSIPKLDSGTFSRPPILFLVMKIDHPTPNSVKNDIILSDNKSEHIQNDTGSEGHFNSTHTAPSQNNQDCGMVSSTNSLSEQNMETSIVDESLRLEVLSNNNCPSDAGTVKRKTSDDKINNGRLTENESPTSTVQYSSVEKAHVETESSCNEKGNSSLKSNNPERFEIAKFNCSKRPNENIEEPPIDKHSDSEYHDRCPTDIRGEDTTESCDKNSHIFNKPSLEERRKRIRLPVSGGGNLKEIFISPRELSKIKNASKYNRMTPSDKFQANVQSKTEKKVKQPLKYTSHIIKPANTLSSNTNGINKNYLYPQNDVTLPDPQADTSTSAQFPGTNSSAHCFLNVDYETESVISEAVVDDEVLKDNLLATVIDFQAQNNSEFAEIKKFIKDSNSLHRDTNRVLREMLGKM